MTDETKVCADCGEEFEEQGELCEVCAAYGEIESMDYGE